jgi:cyclase
MNLRIIPRLDIKGPNLVKGIHLEGLRVLGRPSEFAKFYYENGADELLFMDVVASLYERNSLDAIIKETANEIFIPLTVGGGIRTLRDIYNVLRSGADKVLINTAAIKNPNFIKEAVIEFGSSTIVVAIEAIKQPGGQYAAFIDNGREYTGIVVDEWAKKIQDLGAGELVITSVDNEGTGKGFDFELIRLVSNNINIPIVAHGGAGNKEHILQLTSCNLVEAICASSIFHYDALMNIEFNIKESSEGNFDFINSGQGVKHIQTIDIASLKEFLIQNGENVRTK